MSAKPSMRRQSRTKEEEKPDTHAETHSDTMEETRSTGMQTNHIYVGKKPVMNYAMSALIQLSQMGEVTIKARGLAISHAVDVAEIVTKRLGNGTFTVKNINITTEQVKSTETGEMRNVSSIEILVGK